MTDWLDMLGSFFVGGIVLLILTNINFSTNSAAVENLYAGITQRSIISATDLIEYDFYKMGFRCSSSKIVLADSTEIKFFSDLDNTGVPDELHYFVGDSTSFPETCNPNDYLLKRVRNSESNPATIPVTDFKIIYFDSLGKKINYTLLTNQSERDKIKTVRIRIECESANKIEDHYEAVEWEKTIKPKNI
jgi:hypothetical protein